MSFDWNFLNQWKKWCWYWDPFSDTGSLWEQHKLSHWGRVTHICVSEITMIGSDNGLSPGRRQAIIWTNAGLLLIGPLGTHFSEIWIEIQTFSFKKIHLKVSSAKRRPFCLGLSELNPNKTNQPHPTRELRRLCWLSWCTQMYVHTSDKVSGNLWKNVCPIHLIPVVYPYGVILLTPVHFLVLTINFKSLVATYLPHNGFLEFLPCPGEVAKYLSKNMVYGMFFLNCQLNSFDTWHLPIIVLVSLPY